MRGVMDEFIAGVEEKRKEPKGKAAGFRSSVAEVSAGEATVAGVLSGAGVGGSAAGVGGWVFGDGVAAGGGWGVVCGGGVVGAAGSTV